MAARPFLALGAAALAVVAGCTAAVVSPRASDGFAVAADTDPGTSAPAARAAIEERSIPHGRVSSAKLRQIDTIEVDAESITLARADDHTVTVLSMRAGSGTVHTLSRLLGEPTRTQTVEGDGGRCLPASTTYTWGGALRIAALATPSDLGNSLEVRILRPVVAATSGDVVQLTGPDGVQVGDDVRSRIRSTPAEHRDFVGSRTDPAWQVLLDEGWPSDRSGAGANGVSALTDDTTVTVIGTPMPVHETQHC